MLENQDRHKIFYKTIDEMLLEDSRYLKAWIKMAQRVFAAAKKEAKVPRNAQKLMESYFSWKKTRPYRPGDRQTAILHNSTPRLT
jgi:hypothetical protein